MKTAEIKSRKFCDTSDCITMEYLLRREGSRTNDSHVPIIRRLITIGRSPNCTITLKSIRVSRMQCEIIFSDGNLFLRDTESSNGTYVNHEKITNELRKLEVGDYVGFGINPFPKRQYEPNQFVFSLQQYNSDKIVELVDDEVIESTENEKTGKSDHNYYLDQVDKLTIDEHFSDNHLANCEWTFSDDDEAVEDVTTKTSKNLKLKYEEMDRNALMKLFDDDGEDVKLRSIHKASSLPVESELMNKNSNDNINIERNIEKIEKGRISFNESCHSSQETDNDEVILIEEKTNNATVLPGNELKLRKFEEKVIQSSRKIMKNNKFQYDSTFYKETHSESTRNPVVVNVEDLASTSRVQMQQNDEITHASSKNLKQISNIGNKNRKSNKIYRKKTSALNVGMTTLKANKNSNHNERDKCFEEKNESNTLKSTKRLTESITMVKITEIPKNKLENVKIHHNSDAGQASDNEVQFKSNSSFVCKNEFKNRKAIEDSESTCMRVNRRNSINQNKNIELNSSESIRKMSEIDGHEIFEIDQNQTNNGNGYELIVITSDDSNSCHECVSIEPERTWSEIEYSKNDTVSQIDPELQSRKLTFLEEKDETESNFQKSKNNKINNFEDQNQRAHIPIQDISVNRRDDSGRPQNIQARIKLHEGVKSNLVKREPMQKGSTENIRNDQIEDLPQKAPTKMGRKVLNNQNKKRITPKSNYKQPFNQRCSISKFGKPKSSKTSKKSNFLANNPILELSKNESSEQALSIKKSKLLTSNMADIKEKISKTFEEIKEKIIAKKKQEIAEEIEREMSKFLKIIIESEESADEFLDENEGVFLKKKKKKGIVNKRELEKRKFEESVTTNQQNSEETSGCNAETSLNINSIYFNDSDMEKVSAIAGCQTLSMLADSQIPINSCIISEPANSSNITKLQNKNLVYIPFRHDMIYNGYSINSHNPNNTDKLTQLPSTLDTQTNSIKKSKSIEIKKNISVVKLVGKESNILHQIEKLNGTEKYEKTTEISNFHQNMKNNKNSVFNNISLDVEYETKKDGKSDCAVETKYGVILEADEDLETVCIVLAGSDGSIKSNEGQEDSQKVTQNVLQNLEIKDPASDTSLNAVVFKTIQNHKSIEKSNFNGSNAEKTDQKSIDYFSIAVVEENTEDGSQISDQMKHEAVTLLTHDSDERVSDEKNSYQKNYELSGLITSEKLMEIDINDKCRRKQHDSNFKNIGLDKINDDLIDDLIARNVEPNSENTGSKCSPENKPGNESNLKIVDFYKSDQNTQNLQNLKNSKLSKSSTNRVSFRLKARKPGVIRRSSRNKKVSEKLNKILAERRKISKNKLSKSEILNKKKSMKKIEKSVENGKCLDGYTENQVMNKPETANLERIENIDQATLQFSKEQNEFPCLSRKAQTSVLNMEVHDTKRKYEVENESLENSLTVKKSSRIIKKSLRNMPTQEASDKSLSGVNLMEKTGSIVSEATKKMQVHSRLRTYIKNNEKLEQSKENHKISSYDENYELLQNFSNNQAKSNMSIDSTYDCENTRNSNVKIEVRVRNLRSRSMNIDSGCEIVHLKHKNLDASKNKEKNKVAQQNDINQIEKEAVESSTKRKLINKEQKEEPSAVNPPENTEQFKAIKYNSKMKDTHNQLGLVRNIWKFIRSRSKSVQLRIRNDPELRSFSNERKSGSAINANCKDEKALMLTNENRMKISKNKKNQSEETHQKKSLTITNILNKNQDAFDNLDKNQSEKSQSLRYNKEPSIIKVVQSSSLQKRLDILKSKNENSPRNLRSRIFHTAGSSDADSISGISEKFIMSNSNKARYVKTKTKFQEVKSKSLKSPSKITSISNEVHEYVHPVAEKTIKPSSSKVIEINTINSKKMSSEKSEVTKASSEALLCQMKQSLRSRSKSMFESNSNGNKLDTIPISLRTKAKSESPRKKKFSMNIRHVSKHRELPHQHNHKHKKQMEDKSNSAAQELTVNLSNLRSRSELIETSDDDRKRDIGYEKFDKSIEKSTSTQKYLAVPEINYKISKFSKNNEKSTELPEKYFACRKIDFSLEHSKSTERLMNSQASEKASTSAEEKSTKFQSATNVKNSEIPQSKCFSMNDKKPTAEISYSTKSVVKLPRELENGQNDLIFGGRLLKRRQSICLDANEKSCRINEQKILTAKISNSLVCQLSVGNSSEAPKQIDFTENSEVAEEIFKRSKSLKVMSLNRRIRREQVKESKQIENDKQDKKDENIFKETKDINTEVQDSNRSTIEVLSQQDSIEYIESVVVQKQDSGHYNNSQPLQNTDSLEEPLKSATVILKYQENALATEINKLSKVQVRRNTVQSDKAMKSENSQKSFEIKEVPLAKTQRESRVHKDTSKAFLNCVTEKIETNNKSKLDRPANPKQIQTTSEILSKNLLINMEDPFNPDAVIPIRLKKFSIVIYRLSHDEIEKLLFWQAKHLKSLSRRSSSSRSDSLTDDIRSISAINEVTSSIPKKVTTINKFSKIITSDSDIDKKIQHLIDRSGKSQHPGKSTILRDENKIMETADIKFRRCEETDVAKLIGDTQLIKTQNNVSDMDEEKKQPAKINCEQFGEQSNMYVDIEQLYKSVDSVKLKSNDPKSNQPNENRIFQPIDPKYPHGNCTISSDSEPVSITGDDHPKKVTEISKKISASPQSYLIEHNQVHPTFKNNSASQHASSSTQINNTTTHSSDHAIHAQQNKIQPKIQTEPLNSTLNTSVSTHEIVSLRVSDKLTTNFNQKWKEEEELITTDQMKLKKFDCGVVKIIDIVDRANHGQDNDELRSVDKIIQQLDNCARKSTAVNTKSSQVFDKDVCHSDEKVVDSDKNKKDNSASCSKRKLTGSDEYLRLDKKKLKFSTPEESENENLNEIFIDCSINANSVETDVEGNQENSEIVNTDPLDNAEFIEISSESDDDKKSAKAIDNTINAIKKPVKFSKDLEYLVEKYGIPTPNPEVTNKIVNYAKNSTLAKNYMNCNSPNLVQNSITSTQKLLNSVKIPISIQKPPPPSQKSPLMVKIASILDANKKHQISTKKSQGLIEKSTVLTKTSQHFTKNQLYLKNVVQNSNKNYKKTSQFKITEQHGIPFGHLKEMSISNKNKKTQITIKSTNNVKMTRTPLAKEPLGTDHFDLIKKSEILNCTKQENKKSDYNISEFFKSFKADEMKNVRLGEKPQMLKFESKSLIKKTQENIVADSSWNKSDSIDYRSEYSTLADDHPLVLERAAHKDEELSKESSKSENTQLHQLDQQEFRHSNTSDASTSEEDILSPQRHGSIDDSLSLMDISSAQSECSDFEEDGTSNQVTCIELETCEVDNAKKYIDTEMQYDGQNQVELEESESQAETNSVLKVLHSEPRVNIEQMELVEDSNVEKQSIIEETTRYETFSHLDIQHKQEKRIFDIKGKFSIENLLNHRPRKVLVHTQCKVIDDQSEPEVTQEKKKTKSNNFQQEKLNDSFHKEIATFPSPSTSDQLRRVNLENDESLLNLKNNLIKPYQGAKESLEDMFIFSPVHETDNQHHEINEIVLRLGFDTGQSPSCPISQSTTKSYLGIATEESVLTENKEQTIANTDLLNDISIEDDDTIPLPDVDTFQPNVKNLEEILKEITIKIEESHTPIVSAVIEPKNYADININPTVEQKNMNFAKPKEQMIRKASKTQEPKKQYYSSSKDFIEPSLVPKTKFICVPKNIHVYNIESSPVTYINTEESSEQKCSDVLITTKALPTLSSKRYPIASVNKDNSIPVLQSIEPVEMNNLDIMHRTDLIINYDQNQGSVMDHGQYSIESLTRESNLQIISDDLQLKENITSNIQDAYPSRNQKKGTAVGKISLDTPQEHLKCFNLPELRVCLKRLTSEKISKATNRNIAKLISNPTKTVGKRIKWGRHADTNKKSKKNQFKGKAVVKSSIKKSASLNNKQSKSVNRVIRNVQMTDSKELEAKENSHVAEHAKNKRKDLANFDEDVELINQIKKVKLESGILDNVNSSGSESTCPGSSSPNSSAHKSSAKSSACSLSPRSSISTNKVTELEKSSPLPIHPIPAKPSTYDEHISEKHNNVHELPKSSYLSIFFHRCPTPEPTLDYDEGNTHDATIATKTTSFDYNKPSQENIETDHQIYIQDSDDENEDEVYSKSDDERILKIPIISLSKLISEQKSILKKCTGRREHNRNVSFYNSVFVRTFLTEDDEL